MFGRFDEDSKALGVVVVVVVFVFVVVVVKEFGLEEVLNG